MKSTPHRAWHTVGLQHVQGSWYRKLGYRRQGGETKAWIIIVCKWCLSHDCYGFTLKCWQEQGHLKKG